VHAEEPLQFGDSIRLFQMTDVEFERLTNMFQAILETTKHTPEEKVILRAQMERDVGELKQWTCAEVSIVGDDKKAKDDAEELAEPMLDLLQMIAAIESPHAVSITAGIVATPRPPLVIVEAKGTHATWHRTYKHTHRVNVNTGVLTKLREQGFATLLDAVAKQPTSHSKYEAMLVNSMHWIADAQKQASPANSVTSYVTAFELFFATDGSPITRDVSEGVAYVLGGTLEQRKYNRKLITSLYSRRSKVSHEGQRDVEDAEVFQLKLLSINFLARMSKLAWRFQNRDDVRSWIADLRLEGQYKDEPPAPEAAPGPPA